MKCQTFFFSRKNKKNISLSSSNFAQRVPKALKITHSIVTDRDMNSVEPDQKLGNMASDRVCTVCLTVQQFLDK